MWTQDEVDTVGNVQVVLYPGANTVRNIPGTHPKDSKEWNMVLGFHAFWTQERVDSVEIVQVVSYQGLKHLNIVSCQFAW